MPVKQSSVKNLCNSDLKKTQNDIKHKMTGSTGACLKRKIFNTLKDLLKKPYIFCPFSKSGRDKRKRAQILKWMEECD